MRGRLAGGGRSGAGFEGPPFRPGFDVDLLFQHYGVLASRLGVAGVAPTTTMLGVTRLAIPGQKVELEGSAVA